MMAFFLLIKVRDKQIDDVTGVSLKLSVNYIKERIN